MNLLAVCTCYSLMLQKSFMHHNFFSFHFIRGSCSIQDDHSHGKKSHQIQAHPPYQVRRKIYEFSKKMPEVIHFQLVPAKKFWTDLFEEHIPDERDIGLYFIPSAKERCAICLCVYLVLSRAVRLFNLSISF